MSCSSKTSSRAMVSSSTNKPASWAFWMACKSKTREIPISITQDNIRCVWQVILGISILYSNVVFLLTSVEPKSLMDNANESKTHLAQLFRVLTSYSHRELCSCLAFHSLQLASGKIGGVEGVTEIVTGVQLAFRVTVYMNAFKLWMLFVVYGVSW